MSEQEETPVHEGPDPRQWAYGAIGEASADLRLVQQTIESLTAGPSDGNAIGPCYRYALGFLRETERTCKERLAAELLSAFGIDISVEEPAPGQQEGARPDIVPDQQPFADAGRARAFGNLADTLPEKPS